MEMNGKYTEKTKLSTRGVSKKLGEAGESKAAMYLDSHGFQILERNYRCRFGEIDIIAMEGSTLCFMEVKTRSSTAYGMPSQAVIKKKEQRIQKSAQIYLRRCPVAYREIRIDIIEVLYLHGRYYIRLLRNGRYA